MRAFGSGGAGSRLPAYPSTRPKRSDSACHSSRKATISSWDRPTKFHHMTIDSRNGSPPRSTTRAGEDPGFDSVRRVSPGAT